jgi:hypothetical protein
VVGRDKGNYAIAQEIQRRVGKIPGAVDVHLHQPLDVPDCAINVDRTKASAMGFTQSDVANSVLVSLSGTAQVAPNYWLDAKGANYRVIVQTPQHALDSLEKLGTTPSSHGPRRHPAAGEPRDGRAPRGHGGGQPLQRPAGLRHLRRGRRPRPRGRRSRGGPDRRGDETDAARGTTIQVRGRWKA